MSKSQFIYLPNLSKHIDYSNQMIIEDDLLEEIKNNLNEEDNEDNKEENNKENNYILNSLSSVLLQIEQIKDLFISIDISNNRLLDKGLLLLVDSLKEHENIKYISIVNNKATRNGIYNFVMKILDFKNVPYVDIRGNFGSDLQCIKRILENIDENKQIILKEKIIWYGTEEFKWK
jgi:acyl carrier protein